MPGYTFPAGAALLISTHRMEQALYIPITDFSCADSSSAPLKVLSTSMDLPQY